MLLVRSNSFNRKLSIGMYADVCNHGFTGSNDSGRPADRQMSRPYKMIDLFAGAGGMTAGFKSAGFVPILAVEKEADFAATYVENHGDHVLTGDVADVVNRGGIQLDADLVIGGPPCQGFSNLTGNRANDPRRSMWRFFMDVVESTRCKVFVVENVTNLLHSAEGYGIIQSAEKLGYTVKYGILKTSDFGVPQNRRRAIIIGSRVGTIDLPSPDNRRMTVREAFHGIPEKPHHYEIHASPISGSQLHIGRNPTAVSLQRYKLIPPGGNRFDLQELAPEITPACWIRKTKGGTDIFGRLVWDEPARCTIRCEFYKPEKGRYLHPSADRPITHWEAARLQTFPDTYRWHGTKIRVAVQIGNAVPPLFAKCLAKHIMKAMKAYGADITRMPGKPDYYPSLISLVS